VRTPGRAHAGCSERHPFHLATAETGTGGPFDPHGRSLRPLACPGAVRAVLFAVVVVRRLLSPVSGVVSRWCSRGSCCPAHGGRPARLEYPAPARRVVDRVLCSDGSPAVRRLFPCRCTRRRSSAPGASASVCLRAVGRRQSAAVLSSGTFFCHWLFPSCPVVFRRGRVCFRIASLFPARASLSGAPVQAQVSEIESSTSRRY